MKKRWRTAIGALTAAAMLCASISPFAAAQDMAQTEADAPAPDMARTEADAPEGQLTLSDIDAASNGEAKVFTHDGQVTYVEGACTADAVNSMEDAAKVADSMIWLIGGDEKTEFRPWATFTDTAGNQYYVFQQVYGDSTVEGGAVKIITDSEGGMIAFSGSIETELPDAEEGGISKEEAEQIVLSHAEENDMPALSLMKEWTREIILPNMLKIDIVSDDSGARFVWAVYTNNPAGSADSRQDLPYLAHYVTMSGEYLYSLPTITPGDRAGESGFDTDYVFEFMEPAEYSGYVDLSDGTEKKINVTLMRDKRTGMYYLGNLERKIIVADCYEFLYNDGSIVAEYSPDNKEWDQVGLCSLYNYCLAYDYYKEIGWNGADNEATPILILNNFCDENHMGIDNACYCGYLLGWQVFAASQANDFSQCLDIIAHEFTHCVTHTAMTYNAYINDYGAINEAMSDIQGQFCKMMNIGAEHTAWVMGEQSVTPARSMKEPHLFGQPEYVWDVHYIAPVETPTEANDQGGVHSNSSLLNYIAYRLYEEGGMSMEEARAFWFAVDCTMVPKTDYVQLSEMLPSVLKHLGMTQYEDALTDAIEATRISKTTLPEDLGDHHALVRLTLPDTEAMTDGNWMLQVLTVDLDRLIDKIKEYHGYLSKNDLSFLPPLTRSFVEEMAGSIEDTAEKAEKKSIPELLMEFGSFLLEGLMSDSEPETETEAVPIDPALEQQLEEISLELQDWIAEELDGIFAFGNGSAGQDGRTVEMVSNTGYALPMLQHIHVVEGSMTQVDQIGYAILIGGRWYDLSSDLEWATQQMQEGKEADPSELLESDLIQNLVGDLLPKLLSVKGMEDVLSMIFVDIQEDGVCELPVKGLEDIRLPDTPPVDMLASDPVTPGPKSRPAEEAAETESEDTTQTVAADAAETEAETTAEDAEEAAGEAELPAA